MTKFPDNRPHAEPVPPAVRGARASLVLCGVVLVAFRLHAFEVPLETDECNYAYISARLLAGDLLYVDVWDHQPFGVYALVAAIVGVFGDAPEVFRWVATAFSLVSLALIYGITRRCAGFGGAICAAALFAIASSDPGTAGYGCNREIYMNAFILGSWYLALREDGPSGRAVFASGCLLAFASAIKTVVAVHWLLLALWIALENRRRPGPAGRPGRMVRALALFAAGPVTLWMGAVAYFAATKRLTEFVDAVFLFNLSYSDASGHFLARFGRFFAPAGHPFIFDSALPLWLGAAAATVWLIVDAAAGRRRRSLALLLLLVAGYVAACLPARFWRHYYYLMLPPMIVSVAAGLDRLAAWLRRVPGAKSPVMRHAAWGPALLLAIWLLAAQYTRYLKQSPFGITAELYHSRDFWGRAMGQKVRRVTDPGDTVFVYGNEAEVYYYARRRCATRYTMITGIGSRYAGADRRRRTLMDDLRRHRPRLILVLFDEAPFPEWAEFLARHYGTAIGWDCHDRYTQSCDSPRPEYVTMLVYAAKDRPVAPIAWGWDRSEIGGWLPGEKR